MPSLYGDIFDYDLLEDRIYFSEYNSELNFTEITAQLIGN